MPARSSGRLGGVCGGRQPRRSSVSAPCQADAPAPWSERSGGGVVVAPCEWSPCPSIGVAVHFRPIGARRVLAGHLALNLAQTAGSRWQSLTTPGRTRAGGELATFSPRGHKAWEVARLRTRLRRAGADRQALASGGILLRARLPPLLKLRRTSRRTGLLAEEGSGAGEGTRTPDVQLGKLTFYR
jgi:hypothetical protein